MGRLNLSYKLQIIALKAILSGPTRPNLNCPCSSAVEHSLLDKGEVSGSSPDEGMAKALLKKSKKKLGFS